MKVLRLVPLALILAACSSVNVPISPYRIDVQQGNALEQESVEKLKPGLTRSQVRFLLGTPLLVDPFHGNRWDYVYNFRKAGKLTEQKRLVLFFDGDVLARIEAEGLVLKIEEPAVKPVEAVKPAAEKEGPTQPLADQPPLVAEPLPTMAPKPAPTPSAAPVVAMTKPVEAVPAPAAPAQPVVKPVEVTPAQAVVKPVEVAPAQPVVKPVEVTPAPVVSKPAVAAPNPAEASQPVSAGERSLDETSIVRPLRSGDTAEQPSHKPAVVGETKPEPVALQTEANVEAIKPDVMPEFPNASLLERKVMAALNAWAEAWRDRNEEAYLAAYAASFRPADGQGRPEWEKRRRLLLGISRNIDLKIESVTVEEITEDRAQINFRQFYRSDTYQDAAIKRLKFVRVDDQWLIEEETVLAPIGGNQ